MQRLALLAIVSAFLGLAQPSSAQELTANETLEILRVSEECSDKHFYAGALNYWQHRHQRSSQFQSDQDQRRRAEEAAPGRQFCLKQASSKLPPHVRSGPKFQALIDGSADYIDNLMREGRREFEEAPGRYTFVNGPRYSSDYTPAKLREIAATARATRSLVQTCGSFSYVQPAFNRDSLARKRAEIERYRTCLDQYADPTPFSAFEFERVREELDALSPYRCSARPGRDCIQDAKWSEFARIATPEAVLVRLGLVVGVSLAVAVDAPPFDGVADVVLARR